MNKRCMERTTYLPASGITSIAHHKNDAPLWRFLIPVVIGHVCMVLWLSQRPAVMVLPAEISAETTAIKSFLYYAPKRVVSEQELTSPDDATTKDNPENPQHDEKQDNQRETSKSLRINKKITKHTDHSTLTTRRGANVRQATAEFLQRKRFYNVNQLSQQYATQQTARKTLSTMTAEPDELALSITAVEDKNGTLDLALDPNRIVKDGETCYRVVKTPTQLNPHAENLGFAFKCGKSDNEKLFNDVLKSYVSQHRR